MEDLPGDKTNIRLWQKAYVCHSTHMCGFWKDGGVGMSGSFDVGFTGGLAKFSLRALRLPGSKNERWTLLNMDTRLDSSNCCQSSYFSNFCVYALEISLHVHIIISALSVAKDWAANGKQKYCSPLNILEWWNNPDYGGAAFTQTDLSGLSQADKRKPTVHRTQASAHKHRGSQCTPLVSLF